MQILTFCHISNLVFFHQLEVQFILYKCHLSGKPLNYMAKLGSYEASLIHQDFK